MRCQHFYVNISGYNWQKNSIYQLYGLPSYSILKPHFDTITYHPRFHLTWEISLETEKLIKPTKYRLLNPERNRRHCSQSNTFGITKNKDVQYLFIESILPFRAERYVLFHPETLDKRCHHAERKIQFSFLEIPVVRKEKIATGWITLTFTKGKRTSDVIWKARRHNLVGKYKKTNCSQLRVSSSVSADGGLRWTIWMNSTKPVLMGMDGTNHCAAIVKLDKVKLKQQNCFLKHFVFRIKDINYFNSF